MMVSAPFQGILDEIHHEGIDSAMGIAAHTGIFPDSGIYLHALLLRLSHLAWVTGIAGASLGMTDFAAPELVAYRALRLLETGFL